MNSSGNSSDLDFYSGYFQIRPSLIFFATCSALVTPIAISILYFIIWFEHNGPDTRRTLVNRLVSPICTVTIVYFIGPQSIDFFRYFYGPYPHGFCYFNLFAKNVLTVMNMFFFTFITLSRYVSIFVLKNPLGYYDDFWSRLICLLVTFASICIQLVLDFLPGKHPVNYFVCTGKNPALDTNMEKNIIRNHSMFGGCFMVIIIYVFVQIRILLFKRTANEGNKIFGNACSPDLKPMTDYLVIVSYIIFLILHMILLLKIQSLDMTKMDVYPNYIFLYYLHLWLIPNFSLMLTSVYFARNRHLREMLLKEIRGFLTQVFSSKQLYNVNDWSSCKSFVFVDVNKYMFL